jgi:hypothetical protein
LINFEIERKLPPMKKNLLLIAAALMCSAAFAQIPNYSFENWTNMGNYSDPDNWGTLNSTTDLFSVYTVTQGTPGNPGSYYLKITSKTVLSTVVPGVAATGVINPANQTVTGGFPFTTRPAVISGKWQYMAMSGTDQGSINVFLSHWNTSTNSRDTISLTQYMLPGMVMAWANFSIPLTYQSSAFPDTCVIVLASSNNTPAANSYLYVDALSFAGAVGIDETAASENNLSVYPNPGASFVNISFIMENPANVKLQLVDVSGKLIRKINPSVMKGENVLTMDLEGIENGIYFLRLETATAVETKKISIQ